MSEYEAAFTAEFLAAKPVCSEDMFCECDECNEPETKTVDRR